MRNTRQLQDSLRAKSKLIAVLGAVFGVFVATVTTISIMTVGSAQATGGIAMNTSPPIYGGGTLMAPDPAGGYWVVTGAGVITSREQAPIFGSPSLAGTHLNQPIVGMAATPDGRGYWLVASDGGIFTYGDADFYGSAGAIHLNQPIVGMAATPDGRGYWLVASDGGIFTYGDTDFYGSAGAIHLNQPIVAMAATPDGRGYWLVASDGGIFTYGDADFYGSLSGSGRPVAGIIIDPSTEGYILVGANGGTVFAFPAASSTASQTTTT